MNKQPEVKTLSETERFAVWVSQEPDSGDTLYHIEVDNITLHLFEEEWEEFTQLMMEAFR